MAKKKLEYVVRVIRRHVLYDDLQVNYATETVEDKLLECLRYAGLISSREKYFDIICPHGLVSEIWAEQNATRMKTFGFNAFKTLRNSPYSPSFVS